VSYGLGLFVIAGWIGHNGSLPGYQSLTIYLRAPAFSHRETISGDIARIHLG
jgi:D-alanyl-D-alanine carboxypeptidase